MSNEKMMEISREMSKAEYERDEATSKVLNLKDQYREQLVDVCIENILKVQEREGKLSKRDFEIFIGHLGMDLRNLYIQR